MSRPHPFDMGGLQVVVPAIEKLTPSEKRRLAQLFASLPKQIAKAPAPFEWLPEAPAGKAPVLERSKYDNREYWISLYEADGDCVFADVVRNDNVWLGSEWTVRPVDLRMLEG